MGVSGRGARFTFTLPVSEEAGAASDQLRPSQPGGERPPVLVVDDDPQMLRFVRDALSEAGYAPLVSRATTANCPGSFGAEKPSLVLLDLILPGADGIELMESVPELADLPVIFISAYGRDETIARALESGAADYLVKPFSATELVARIRAALRKRDETEPFVLGDLAIHHGQRRVSMAGRPLRLTATEYELLHVLSVNAGRVMTYDALIRRIWNSPDKGDSERIRTFVKQLRRKLGDDPARPAWILNVRGVGYQMPGPEEA